jgi:Zn finger protein HypA/HybF involved in hydrogenase expression|tara:strand:+ start:1073 stop:1234 length:162 start_codon:yes stop_codon:yes gene_type:complete
MAKFPEAQARLFKNKFACKKCKKVKKTNIMKIIDKKVSCKRCGSKSLRSLRKK